MRSFLRMASRTCSRSIRCTRGRDEQGVSLLQKGAQQERGRETADVTQGRDAEGVPAAGPAVDGDACFIFVSLVCFFLLLNDGVGVGVGG